MKRVLSSPDSCRVCCRAGLRGPHLVLRLSERRQRIATRRLARHRRHGGHHRPDVAHTMRVAGQLQRPAPARNTASHIHVINGPGDANTADTNGPVATTTPTFTGFPAWRDGRPVLRQTFDMTLASLVPRWVHHGLGRHDCDGRGGLFAGIMDGTGVPEHPHDSFALAARSAASSTRVVSPERRPARPCPSRHRSRSPAWRWPAWSCVVARAESSARNAKGPIASRRSGLSCLVRTRLRDGSRAGRSSAAACGARGRSLGARPCAASRAVPERFSDSSRGRCPRRSTTRWRHCRRGPSPSASACTSTRWRPSSRRASARRDPGVVRTYMPL